MMSMTNSVTRGRTGSISQSLFRAPQQLQDCSSDRRTQQYFLQGYPSPSVTHLSHSIQKPLYSCQLSHRALNKSNNSALVFMRSDVKPVEKEKQDLSQRQQCYSPLQKTNSTGQIWYHLQDSKVVNHNEQQVKPKSNANVKVNPDVDNKEKKNKQLDQIKDLELENNELSEQYFQYLRTKYLNQYANIRNKVNTNHKKEKENLFQKKVLQVGKVNVSTQQLKPSNTQIKDLLIPTVHSEAKYDSKEKQSFVNQVIDDLEEIVRSDKELLKKQWVIFQKYEGQMKGFIDEIWTLHYKSNQSVDECSLLNGFLGVNTITKLFGLLDIHLDETKYQLLFPFIKSQNISQQEVRKQINDLFLSPSFFLQKQDQQQCSNFAELQKVMKSTIEIKLHSEELFQEFLKKYTLKQVKANQLFNALSNDDVITPKSLSNVLKKQCKPDYCLHLLFRFSPQNCLQVIKSKFLQSFQ